MEQLNPYENLSGSCHEALAWAGARAQARSTTIPTQSSMPNQAAFQGGEVNDSDLLVGMMQAHPWNSEALRLTQHFGIPLEQLQRGLDFVPQQLPSDLPKTLPSPDQLSSTVQAILGEARLLGEKYNPQEKGLVRMRDLFGGLLMADSPTRNLLSSLLARTPIPLAQVLSIYPDFLSDAAKWVDFSDFLSARFPRTHLAVAGFSTDTTPDEDLVGIGAEVDAFAYLIAATDMHPPLAIGLFGDWGAGKSYFMQALKGRVEQITQDVQKVKPQAYLSIFKSVVQIEFNAWHYVEGELWASLVDHIFNNLRIRSGEEPTLLQERQRVVLDKIDSVRQRKREQEEQRHSLQQQLAAQQDTIDQLKSARDQALQKLNNLRVEDVLAGIQLSQTDKDRFNQILQEQGITRTFDSAAEFTQALSDLHATLTRANALGVLVRQRGWRWTAGLVLVLLSAPVVSALIAWAGQNQVPALTNALLSLSTFISLLTVMVKSANARLGSAVTQVEGAQAKLDAARRTAEQDYRQQLDQLKTEYNQLAAQYDRAWREEQDLAAQIQSLERELAALTPGRVLLDFINERAGSQDYRRLLGVPALIRRDFTQLSELIRTRNERLLAKGESEAAAAQVEQEDQDPHLFNRIVLYIDDLDRCPPDRVVQVLQAVHLLMAFPLFVVIVAVDARWLSQSLQKHYQGLLQSTAPRKEGELVDLPQATPQDYMEKIFQVPFWVRPLSDEARLRIITGLVSKSLQPEGPDRGGQGRPDEAGQGTGSAPSAAAHLQVQWGESKLTRPLRTDSMTDPNPPGLEILERELAFMGQLKSLLGLTPRAVKRYVNIYRLVKTMAMSQAQEFTADRPDADFKQVLFLLAVLTGLPAISRDFFELLHELELSDETPAEGEKAPPHSLEQVLQELQVRVCGPVGAGPLTRPAANQAPHEFERLSKWLRTYEKGSWLVLDANPLAAWMPQVTRFSFDEPG
ncbi:MAG: P-loop NTPase fold protein [Anaerolineae bacterium]